MIYASRYLRLTNPYMQGPDIYDLQLRLKTLGFFQHKPNGIYDQATVNSVVNFQKYNRIFANGIVGKKTWSALKTSELPILNQQVEVDIDLNSKTLTVKEDDVVVAIFPIAIGMPSTPTPLGYWLITEKLVEPGGAFGSRWLRISVPWGGYGIHGTDNPDSIGKEASHGCIRMFNDDVERLYDLVTIGTPVNILGNVQLGRILQQGDSGDDVAQVQNQLMILGYYRGEIDGVFDQQLKQAVANFQREQKIKPNGIIDGKTYEALQLLWDITFDVVNP